MSHRLPARARLRRALTRRSRPGSRVGRPARLSLGVVKVALVGSIAAAGWGTSVEATSQSVSSPAPAADRAVHASGRLDRVLDAHDCSVTGFGDDSVPRSAVVRSASGHLRLVDFETGWRVYHRHDAARLIAVCHDAPPAERG